MLSSKDRRRLGAAVAAAMSAVMAPMSVQAQGQTVESAQQFLSMVVPGAGYRPGGLYAVIKGNIATVEMEEGLRPGSTTFEIGGTGSIVSYAAAGRCTQRVQSNLFGLTVYYHFGRVNRSKPYESSVGAPGDIYWSTLLKANVVGSTVYLTWKGQNVDSEFHFPDSTLAARVAYAMEFLRLECDTTKSTGF